MVKSGNNWLIFLIVVLAVQLLSAHGVAAYPDLDVQISETNIAVSALPEANWNITDSTPMHNSGCISTHSRCGTNMERETKKGIRIPRDDKDWVFRDFRRDI